MANVAMTKDNNGKSSCLLFNMPEIIKGTLAIGHNNSTNITKIR